MLTRTMKTELFQRSGEINGFAEIVLRSGCTVDFSTRCMPEVSQRGCAAREEKEKKKEFLSPTYLFAEARVTRMNKSSLWPSLKSSRLWFLSYGTCLCHASLSFDLTRSGMRVASWFE